MDESRRTLRLRYVLVGILVGVAAAYLVFRTSLTIGDVEALASPQPSTRLPHSQSREFAKRVQQGGLIIYFRHAQRQKWDSVIAFDVFEVATGANGRNEPWHDAVCLTPQGEQEASMIGRIFELAHVRVGYVVASPSCRAQQTAELAFSRIDRTSTALVHTPALNVDNLETFRDALAKLLHEVPITAGSNAVVVAHTNTLENNASIFAAGTEWLADPLPMETGFYVIERRPDDTLAILYEFSSLGEFASGAISLDPATLPPAAAAAAAGRQVP